MRKDSHEEQQSNREQKEYRNEEESGHKHGHCHQKGESGSGHEHHAGHQHERECGYSHEHHAGHHHEEECGCGHEHHAGHQHERECGCGHEHHAGYHHEEECGCGHEHHAGHQHGRECGCSHEHHAGHHHEEECGCGHEHHAGYQHEGECGCGHEHHAGHHHDAARHTGHEFDQVGGHVRQKIYILENLGCANCAAKMEKAINELPQVEAATITYATKQLRVAANHQEKLLPELQRICSSIEHQVTVVPRGDAAPEKKQKRGVYSEHKKEILSIGLGAALFLSGGILEHLNADLLSGGEAAFSAVIFVFAYILLGWEIVLTAVKNLKNGRVFDENFLMSTATIAAFAIGDFAEAVGVMLFYRVGELFEDIAVERSRSQIMGAVDMRPEVVNLVRGDQVEEIPAGDAAAGDIILIRPGDRVGLDGIVAEGESRIDTSPVTGEPVPVAVKEGDEILSGCVNERGALKLRVSRPLSESMVTRILDSVENAAAGKPKMDRFITRFARIYTPIVVLAASLTAVVPSVLTGDWNHWIYTAITFLVISCPCALVLSVPLAFFSGIGAGSRQGILFKGGLAIEALKNIKAVVMDKTGTITKGEFKLQQVIPYGKFSAEELLNMAAECELLSTHPIGNSIVAAAKEKNLELHRPEKAEEISGKGIRAEIDGKEILCGNRALMELYGISLAGYQNEQYGTEALVAVEDSYAGCLVIADTIKEDAVESIQYMKRQGIVTAMLTGDSKASAEAVALKTGIDEVHAKLLPEEKLTRLKEIRQKYGAAMFVGDGINDAPVLAGADVGAAMGSGADAAIEAADVVFMNSSVKAIGEAIRIAKVTGNIAVQNVVFALAVKALVMVMGFMGCANMWMAVFADTGVAMLCVLNSIRALYARTKK
ncbi:MAG: cadmium-translocating P-type ATPase [Dorea sp.]|nr:cadmium-translocating P-type ATPase [Dorea sp.]